MPLVFVREIRAARFGDTKTKFVTPEKADELNVHRVYPGDLLVTKMGDPPGDTAIYPDNRPPAVITSDCIRLLPDSRLTSSAFLKYALKAEPSRSAILDNAKGVAQQKLSLERFRTVELVLPPLPEQRRIVAKIEALQARSDAAKEALDAIPPLLEKFRQSVLAAAFRGDLTRTWREQHPDVEPATELLNRIRAERRRKWEEANPKKKYVEPEPVDAGGLPELPKGWCWANVDTLTTRVADGVHKTPNYVESGIPFVTVKNLTAGPGISFEQLNYITPEDHAEFTKRTRPEKGDVLISKDGTLGVVRLIDTERVFSIFVSVALMKPVVTGFGPYLALMLETPQVQGLLVATGSGLKHLHLGDLRATPVPLAPSKEQRMVIERTKTVLLDLAQIEAKAGLWANDLSALNQSILAKAFRGELVPQDPNDEPASDLLDRIRKEREAGREDGGKVKRGKG